MTLDVKNLSRVPHSLRCTDDALGRPGRSPGTRTGSAGRLPHGRHIHLRLTSAPAWTARSSFPDRYLTQIGSPGARRPARRGLDGPRPGFALSGYRQGFIVGVAVDHGFLGGGVLGATLAPRVAGLSPLESLSTVTVPLVSVFVFAWVGQVVAALLGDVMGDEILWKPARRSTRSPAPASAWSHCCWWPGWWGRRSPTPPSST